MKEQLTRLKDELPSVSIQGGDRPLRAWMTDDLQRLVLKDDPDGAP